MTKLVKSCVGIHHTQKVVSSTFMIRLQTHIKIIILEKYCSSINFYLKIFFEANSEENNFFNNNDEKKQLYSALLNYN